MENARQELEALRRDFVANAEDGRLPVRCGVHKRVYSYVEKYDADFLKRGAFAGLAQQGEIARTQAAQDAKQLEWEHFMALLGTNRASPAYSATPQSGGTYRRPMGGSSFG